MDVDGALLESEERYRSVVTVMAEGVVLQDASYAILACNEAAERLLGLTADQMTGRSSLDPRWRAIHEDGSPFPGETHPVPVTLRTGEPQRDVVMGVHKPDGSLTWISINSQPLFRKGETKPYAAVCTFADITPRVAAEDALRQSEERYRRILDTTLEGVWTVDLEGNTTFANRRMAEILGCTPDELARANMWDFVDPADRAVVAERMAARSRGVSEQHEFRFRRRDQVFVWTDLVATPITHADGKKGALAMVRDVTASRRMQAELHKSETRLNLALTAGQMATWEWNLSTGEVSHSEQLCDLLGLPRDASIADRAAYFEHVHPDDRDELTARMKRYADGRGERFFNEYRIVRPDGQVRWVHSTGRAFRDPEGQVRILGTVADITQRRALEEQLHQARKLESIGRLAGGVAHDFNNLLTVILASVMFAERAAPNVKEELATVRSAAERAAALTRQLLAFARKQVIALTTVDLNTIVAGMEPMLRRLLGEDITLSCRYGADLWTVRSDSTQLEQVLINLAVNAREAMPHGGPVDVETRNVVLDASYTCSDADFAPGEYVAMIVSDAGTGIDAVTLPHVFEPFFTTKRSGTGLGLASSYGIVKQLRGHIAVKSEPGKGARFEVYLPRDTSSVSPASEHVPPRHVVDTKKTLLVVEDDDLLRGVVLRGLVGLGFDVLVASDGEEALALVARHPGPIDALITDVVMPRMSGRQLAERVRALRPKTKILFVSGYTDQVIARHGVLEPDQHFLPKPYTMAALADRIAALFAM